MALDASIELALKVVSINSQYTNGNPQFMPNGETLLIDRCVRHAQRLEIYRQIHEVQAEVAGPLVDSLLDSIAHLFSVVEPTAFETAEPSTLIDACILHLSDFGFRLRPDVDIDQVRKDPFWDTESLNAQALRAKLQSWFRHDHLSELSGQRFEQLWSLGRFLSEKAEHVPFGSLACAIGRILDRPITLWALDSMDKDADRKRAIRYTRRTAEGLEEIIFYAPSKQGKSSLDFWTRFTVAHELAHVALRHAPGTESSPSEELEAHCLAIAFLLLHGAPFDRQFPTDEQLRHILDGTDLKNAEKTAILARIKTVFSEAGSPIAAQATRPFVNDGQGAALGLQFGQALQQWRTDPEFRASFVNSVKESIARVSVDFHKEDSK